MKMISRLLPAVALSCVVGASGAAAQQSPNDKITRDEYVQHAAEAAGKRFDMIDTAHTGTLTREQLRSWVMEHRHVSPASQSPG